MGEIAESQGVSTKGFQTPVDGFGGSVGDVVVEVGQHVVASSVQGAAELGQFLEPGGQATA